MNDGLEQRIYSRGTKMSEVPDTFHGLTLLEWQALWIHEQCEAYLASLKAQPAKSSTPELAALQFDL